MNIEDYKYLFTPVSEGLPEENGIYNCIVVDLRYCFIKVCKTMIYNNGIWFNDQGNKDVFEVTHYLDLPKLTTKERAIDLSKYAYKEGMQYWDQDHQAMTMSDIINEKQKEL